MMNSYSIFKMVWVFVFCIAIAPTQAQKTDANAHILRGKVIHTTERMPIENEQVLLKLSEALTVSTYTDELGNFEFDTLPESYSPEKAELAVLIGFKTFLFTPKEVNERGFVLCEVNAQKEEMLITGVRINNLREREIFHCGCEPRRTKGRNFVSSSLPKPSHKYTMESQIMTISEIYGKER